MKIIADITASHNPQVIPQEPVRLVWPDSCWLLSDRPLYIPDFAGRFRVMVMAAYKANRLGKNISPRFASRYLSEFSVALVLLPEEAVDALERGVTIPSRQYIFDNAVVLGDWHPVPPSGLVIATAIADDREEHIIDSMPQPTVAAAMLHSVSRCNTVKMGDVLLVPVGLPPLEISENLLLTIKDSQSGTILLTTRFK